MAQWVLGAVVGLLAFFGLMIAARANDDAFAIFGYLLFLFGIATIFTLIHRNTRGPEQHSM